MGRAFQTEINGKPLIIEIGTLAEQASGAVTVRYGDTVVLVTACMATPREGIDFFPLTVDYEERLYAAGRIPGSFFRREGRPTQEATLSARLTDRAIRPLFPKGFKNEVQVICTILSADRENPPDILAMVGTSAALAVSDIPFEGPVAACRIGYVQGELVANPTFAQLEESQLGLVVASTRDAVIMVEAEARQVPESLVLEAIQRAQAVNRQVIALIEEMVRSSGKPKSAFSQPPTDPSLSARVEELVRGRLNGAIFSGREKGERDAQVEALQKEVVGKLEGKFTREQLVEAFQDLVRREFRRGVLHDGIRSDGRRHQQIRPVSAAVGILPRTHGSGLFKRGQTQVLTIATLGSPREEQRLDTLSPEETRRFLHHYNFPPFSVGEVRRVVGPGRREIGHGALVERALESVIPGEEEFPYTIRLVSEVLSSNGSTSMASVCGSTLALMDAGVPIKAPVAGIAMGLILDESGRFAVLTDIQGLEDHLGDMDFKVAGTATGINALQMDIKVKGITVEIMGRALEQAREARLSILEKIREAIAEVRSALSPYAPRMVRITIPVDKIGAVIGPGGKTIRSIIEATKTTVEVENDGSVFIGSPDEAALQKARQMVEALVREAEVGGIYTGKVTRITPFGAFVEILPGKDGLVRLGELTDRPISHPEEEVHIGDEVTVMVIEVDNMGRVNLSRRSLFQGETGPGPATAREAAARSRVGPGGPPGRSGGSLQRPPLRRGPGDASRPSRPYPEGPPRGDRRPGQGFPPPRSGPQRRPPTERLQP